MVDKMSFLDLFVASFLVAIVTAAPPTGDKVAKRDPTVHTFDITLHGLSGIEILPSWTFTADNTKKSKEIESHLLHEGGHGKEHGAHAGGHPNHASANKPKLSVKSGYYGMIIQHFGPGFEGAHEIVLSRCDNPALEYNLIRYTVPKSLDKDLTTKRKTYIYNVLLACANEQKAKKRRGNKVDGHTDYTH